MTTHRFRCGVVLVVGKTNVGKSTLINAIVRRKTSITSRKPHTTVRRSLGVCTQHRCQTVYIDTPGADARRENAVDESVRNFSIRKNHTIDFVFFVLKSVSWTDDDRFVLRIVEKIGVPVFLIVNQVDRISNKTTLLPHLKFLNGMMNFRKIFVLSAKRRKHVDALRTAIRRELPTRRHLFPKDCFTNQSTKRMVSEIIREKIMRFVGNELPYAARICIEHVSIPPTRCGSVYGSILVEQTSHRKILVGSCGGKIKQIGFESRKSIQKLLQRRIALRLRVKLRPR